MIKKKNAYISYLCLAVALIFILLVFWVDGKSDGLQAAFAVLVFLCLAVSQIYKANTLYCPFCHAGKTFRGSMYFMYCEKAIVKKKKEFVCPDCGKTIIIQ